ncbi:MAG: photosystem reaction center subunit H [Candidatus Goldiibacteriota bacterium HGW-Goldbacteria-1]|jgi:sporulation protein YlmC with PRC-barrel domain|nr:MAG: photosystem reaction center subunit H [Candidatus Goldiibacteriota bacterium HGW-Goldbacteria-1]
MLRSLKSLKGYSALTPEDEMGSVEDFFFDNKLWIIRYLVVKLDKQIPGKSVLVTPKALIKAPDWETKSFVFDISSDMLAKCPDIDLKKPVNRQEEDKLLKHFSWPVYWQQQSIYGSPVITGINPGKITQEPEEEPEEKNVDPHLFSVQGLIKYKIQAKDGEVGNVEDIIIDDETWQAHYLVIDTNSWLPGGKVLVDPSWVDEFEWKRESVRVSVTKETLKQSPVYDPSSPVNRGYETRLYDYHGRPKYWEK